MNTDFLFDGEFGFNYNKENKTLYGGYSMDGNTFDVEFVISEIEEDNIPTAMHYCQRLYNLYGTIVATFKDLEEQFHKEAESLAELDKLNEFAEVEYCYC